MAARRNELKRLGICTSCKAEKSAIGRTSCDGCLEFNAAKKLRRVHAMREAGLCVRCFKPARNRLCGSCKPKALADSRRDLRRRALEEVCRYCRKAPTAPDKTGCRECLDRQAMKSKQRMLSAEKKQQHRDGYKRRYEERKAAGLCTVCAKPAAPLTKCEIHRGIEAARYRLNRTRTGEPLARSG